MDKKKGEQNLMGWLRSKLHLFIYMAHDYIRKISNLQFNFHIYIYIYIFSEMSSEFIF